jgi:hypothetical protein
LSRFGAGGEGGRSVGKSCREETTTGRREVRMWRRSFIYEATLKISVDLIGRLVPLEVKGVGSMYQFECDAMPDLPLS